MTPSSNNANNNSNNVVATASTTNPPPTTASGGGLDKSNPNGLLPNKDTLMHLDEEAALVREEDKLMEDEEVASFDGLGRPVADTELLERRNLTVTLVKSVADNHHHNNNKHRYGLRRRRSDEEEEATAVDGGGSAPTKPDASVQQPQRQRQQQPQQPQQQQHLRRLPKVVSTPPVVPSTGAPSSRSISALPIRGIPGQLPKPTLLQQGGQQPPRLRPETTKTVIATTPRVTPLVSRGNASNPPKPAIPLVKPKPFTKVVTQTQQPPSTTTSQRVVLATPSRTQALINPPTTQPQHLQPQQPPPQMLSAVPNPLANLSNNHHHHHQAPVAVVKKEDARVIPSLPPSSTASASAAATTTTTYAAVPCPLPAVPCPLQAPSSKQQPLAPPQPKRGRIFSIDIDTAGLDFPEMGMENIASSDFTTGVVLPPITGSSDNKADFKPSLSVVSSAQTTPSAQPTADPSAVVVPVSALSDAGVVGRDRAMSFEFFSFGISADEPLPPMPPPPDTTASASGIKNRPRGDSIIFDPISFQDGGIHEEKALMKSGSIGDTPAQEEMALLNAPGFTPTLHNAAPSLTTVDRHHAPPSVGYTPSHTPSSSSVLKDQQQLATLPSSLNTSMNHATFQMDLLNKDGRIGIYLPEARKARIAKFHSKRKMRIWRKRIKYDCRKKLADSRPRIKGRFVKRSDIVED